MAWVNKFVLFPLLIILLLGCSSSMPDTISDSGLKKADQLFEKKLYQEALKEYETTFEKSKGEENLKALYRIAECKALLFRYGEALETIVNSEVLKKEHFELFKQVDPAWKARFLILKGELYREYLKQYSYAQPEEITEGKGDVTRSTPMEMHKEIRSSYEEIWGLREKLATQRIENESYFLDLKDVEKKFYPTLLDLVVIRWSEYLLREAPEDKNAPRQKASALFQEDYSPQWHMRLVSDLPPERLAAFIIEQAGDIGGDGLLGGGGLKSILGDERRTAREIWKVRRVTIPFNYQGKFAWSEERKKDTSQAVSLLKRWSETLKNPDSRAEAAFQAATILSREENQNEAALKLCEKVEKSWPETFAAKKARKLKAEIELPSLALQVHIEPSGGHTTYLTTKNLKKVFFSIYPTNPQELATHRQSYYKRWSGSLNYPDKNLMQFFRESKSAGNKWETEVKVTSGSSIYENVTSKIELPKVDYGIYLLLASSEPGFKVGESLISGVILNRTNLLLIGTSGLEEKEENMLFVPEGVQNRKSNGFHLYLLDAITGKPVEGGNLDIQFRQNYGNFESLKMKTDPQGRAKVQVTANLNPFSYNHYEVDPLAQSGKSFAYWSNGSNLSFTVPNPVELFVDTDRPIYRPGQKVKSKVTVITRVPQGFKTYSGKSKVTVVASDPNGVELFKSEQLLNDIGSLTSEFVIPTGRLLGNYYINASITDWGHKFRGSSSFAVEEYKRPEFEVKLKEAEGVWRFGQKAAVEGDVRYYFGGPVPNANLVVKVSRETYRPWFCWWWSWRFSGSDKREISRSELKTDEKGHFTFSFVPEPSDSREKDPLPARYIVEVEARDRGGRTIVGEKSYVAGKNAYLFSVDPPSGYFAAHKYFSVPSKLMNLNEQPVSGKGNFVVFKIKGDPKYDEVSSYGWSNFQESPSLERLYKDLPSGEKAASGNLVFDGKNPAEIRVNGLDPGVYRLTLNTKDSWGGDISQSIVLLVIDDKGEKVPLNIPSVTIPEKNEYEIGDKARIVIGSSDIKEAINVEIWGGNFLIAHYLLQGGVRRFEVPVTLAHKGGFTLRWFGVKEFKVRSGVATVKVPWKEKNLSASLTFDKKLKPGQKASWLLKVKDRNGNPINGEALVTMYDRSLEYYAKFSQSWSSSLYPHRYTPNSGLSSLISPYSQSIPPEKGWIKKILSLFEEALKEPETPMLRLNKSRLYALQGGRGEYKKQALDKGANLPPISEVTGMESGFAKKDEDVKQVGGMRKQLTQVEPRTHFAETAFFKPQIKIKNGSGEFSFQVPEQLTSWRILATVLTKDIKTGILSEETVTKKDLMVRIEIPRFFREGDSGTIKAVVHNETDIPLSGSLLLSMRENKRTLEVAAEEKLGLKDLKKQVSVKPHSLQVFSWTAKVPRGITTYNVKAAAMCGRGGSALKDAEERELPILPSRERLIETAVVALNGNVARTIALKGFQKQDPTRENESIDLQIDPQLALTILNSIPFLVKYPHECVEQVLNRYVPLSVTNEVYKKHPGIAKATSKIPKRDTITPSWDRKDPRRVLTLLETPWEEISKGRKSIWPIIDMLDPKIVGREKTDALEWLKGAQLSNGAFPWFPGGREDVYMTLYVLAGFAEAQKYGVEVPDDLIRKALNFVNNEIPKRLKPKEEELNLILYAAYVVTSYPQKYPEAQLGFKFAKVWVDFADKHSDAMTPYGKALAAYVYWRLGEKSKGESYLDRALDGSREDEIAGVYWAPEKNSWLWYNDTVEKHAFFLKTLQAVRPKDSRISGMVQWLIFNRKGNEWKSTKASAAAIYALLDFMKQSGALDKGDKFLVKWGDITDSVKVEPDDWLAKPIRWTKLPLGTSQRERLPDFRSYAAAKVEKKGPGFAFASMTWVYSTDQVPEPSEPGLIDIEKTFYSRVKEKDAYHLKPLKSGDTIHVGDQIQVQIKIKTRSSFEYLHLKDPKGAGFESEELRSGWKWDLLARYEEPRDSLTNFFISWLPHGEYILTYRIRPTNAGKFKIGAAVLQSMYAPEFSAHSGGFEVTVKE